MSKLRIVLPLVIALSAACGEKRSDVIERYTPRMAEMRVKLAAIAATLPSADARERLPPLAKLDPPPNFVNETSSGNTDFLMEEQAVHPDVKPDFDLLLSNRLVRYLQWTGPNNPMAASALGERDSAFADEFEQVLALRYVVIVRTAALKKIEVDAATYQGGTATIEAFVVDLPARELRAGVRISGSAADRVSFSVREGENRDARAREAVRSTLWEDLRRKLPGALTAATGGTFRFD